MLIMNLKKEHILSIDTAFSIPYCSSFLSCSLLHLVHLLELRSRAPVSLI